MYDSPPSSRLRGGSSGSKDRVRLIASESSSPPTLAAHRPGGCFRAFVADSVRPGRLWGQPGGSGGDVRLDRYANPCLLGIRQVATGQVHLGGQPSAFVNLTFRCCPKCPIWAPGRFTIEGIVIVDPLRSWRFHCVRPSIDRCRVAAYETFARISPVIRKVT